MFLIYPWRAYSSGATKSDPGKDISKVITTTLVLSSSKLVWSKSSLIKRGLVSLESELTPICSIRLAR